MDRHDDRYSDGPRRDRFGGRSNGWGDGVSGGNWRSGDGGQSEGTWAMSEGILFFHNFLEYQVFGTGKPAGFFSN